MGEVIARSSVCLCIMRIFYKNLVIRYLGNFSMALSQKP